MKLYTTSSADIIQECRVMFGVKSVSKSIFKCRRNVLRVVFDFKMANIRGIKSNNEYIISVLIAYRVLIVHKNTVGGEIWCSLLSTHAFLLDNGQTYATRGVPYYRVSRNFMSRIFSVPVVTSEALIWPCCSLSPLYLTIHFGALLECFGDLTGTSLRPFV